MNFKIIVIVIVILLILIGLFYKKKIEIKLGILYTTNGGSMATNEIECYTTTKNAIDIFNKNQNKFRIITSEFNPQSNTELYKQGAEQLLSEDNMTMIIGVWRSIDRKAVIPIIEKYNNLLNYSVQYEGNECSKNVLYFGACPNQQINVGIEYAIKNISENVILIGSDYVFPRTANNIMKEYIKYYNCNLLLEQYISLDAEPSIFDNICDNIIELTLQYDRCVIMNTINGDLNYNFFDALNKKFKTQYQNDIRSNKLPIFSFSVSAEEMKNFPIEIIYGDYHVWNYSQNDNSYNLFLDSKMKTNNKTLNEMILSFINRKTITGDPSYHSFLSVLFFCDFLLNTKLETYNSKTIRENYIRYKNVDVLTPTGYLKNNNNNHTDNPAFILKINLEKKYDTVFKTSTRISPNPWYDRFSDINYGCDIVNNFLGSKYIENYS